MTPADPGVAAAAPTTLEQARACAQRGQWPLAERLYRELLAVAPEHVDALEGLGLCALQAQRPQEALGWLERAHQHAPGSARVLGHLGLALRHSGQLERAICCFEQAFALAPHEPGALLNRARAERDAGRLPAAIESFQRALALRPELGSGWSMLSNALREAGDAAGAVAAARRALALDPSLHEAHLNEGAALHATGELVRAACSYLVAAASPGLRRAALANLERALRAAPLEFASWPALELAQRLLATANEPGALRLSPTDATALSTLAQVEQAHGRGATALGCLQLALAAEPSPSRAREHASLLWELGHDAAALEHLLGLSEREPADVESYRLLGSWLSVRGQLRAVLSRWTQALARCPDDLEALVRLGIAAQRLGRPSEASALYERLVRARPELPEAHFYLGSALSRQGRHAEANQAYRRVLQLDPSRSVAHSNLLFSLHFDASLTQAELFEAHRAFGQALAAQLPAPRTPLARDPGRRLRIGYVSPDLCAHAVAHFIEPVLAQHDPATVEVYCYSDAARPDAVTERLARLAHSFTACAGWSHEALLERIAADRIDILVDLAGHTARNRLPVFARKPCPVQVSWLGYFDTTGLDSIDYRVADEHAVPPGAERFFVEQVLRLPRTQNCYQPPPAPEPGPLPCQAHGRVRFGYFNNPAKLGREVVGSFGRILRELPESRLLIKYRACDEPGMSARFRAWFADEAVAPERLEIEGHSGMERYLSTLSSVDIALDPFPYSGETTALHALWMGVPVLTLEGPAPVQRLSSRVLRVCGLEEWIAHSPDEYVRLAVERARDVDGLARTRAGLRARLAASPLCDARGVTRELELAYRQMWQRACERDLARGSSEARAAASAA